MCHTENARLLSKSALFALWAYASPVAGGSQGAQRKATLLPGAVRTLCRHAPKAPPAAQSPAHGLGGPRGPRDGDSRPTVPPDPAPFQSQHRERCASRQCPLPAPLARVQCTAELWEDEGQTQMRCFGHGHASHTGRTVSGPTAPPPPIPPRPRCRAGGTGRTAVRGRP